MDMPRPPMPPVTNWTQRQMLEIASRALGRVLAEDLRGITRLSVDEIAAMAGALIVLGLIATPPGEVCPNALVCNSQEEPDDDI